MMLNYKLIKTLRNMLINKNDLSVKTAELSNGLLETLRIMERCPCCVHKKIDRNDSDEISELMNKIENCLTKLEKKEEQGKKKYCIIDELNKELFRIDNKLNKERLCANCKEEIEKLTDECGNERIAKFFLYNCKLDNYDYYDYYGHPDVRWIPSNDFKNVEYLAKVSFGEFHKATWIKYYDYCDEYIQWIPIDEFRNIEYLIKGSFGEFHKANWINGSNPYSNVHFDTRNVVLLKRTCNSDI